MRRVILWVAVLLVSCQTVVPIDPSPTASASPAPASLKTEIPPTETSQATAPSNPSPDPEFKVILHPDGLLYVGDQISIEVISLGDLDPEEKKVQIEVNGFPEEQNSAGFSEFGIGGRLQATFNWIWDTSDLEPGEYEISFRILADGPSWTETVNLQPGEELPGPEPAARWETLMLDCCEIHFISGTDFAQDLPYLGEVIQEHAEEAVLSMGVDFDQRIPITILPRVLGHGGFAANEIYVSYIKENYAGNDLTQVLHHEMIHLLDRRLGGDLRPSLFVEGLAVYLSHGHFKKEPLLSKAAALHEMGWYLPLAELADSFYTMQHEIGYLEGAALVDFMVNKYGWAAFNDFYRDIHPHPSDSEARAIDEALQEHFNISLQQLEGMFTAELKGLHINPDMRADLIQSVNYYDTVRRYQLMLDPSAYFLTAWLPAGEEMRERGIVADYLRLPEDQRNLEIVELLVEVDQHIRAGNYLQAEKSLRLANKELDLVENEVLSGN